MLVFAVVFDVIDRDLSIVIYNSLMQIVYFNSAAIV